MTQLFNQAKTYIENYELEKHDWAIFIEKANQKEFLKSQKGFYYAVKAFPQMLCKLASLIENPEIRLTVVENIWEEHGQGNAHSFHTHTYFQYLQSLGFEGNAEQLEHQPWIQEWIEHVMAKKMSAPHYAAYLSGIEYVYARISNKICHHLNSYRLKCEQTHYAKHSVLDYAHATELLQVSTSCSSKETNQELFESFKLGVDEFLMLFKNMVFLTEQEAKEIANNKIAFYYAREDSSIECKALEKLPTKKARVLMVCSGGENAIELLKMEKSVHITAIDINDYQIKLAQQKIMSINMTGRINHEMVKFNEGKFEQLFAYLKSKLTYDDMHLIANNDSNALHKLKYICENIFSHNVLETVFTSEATKYSTQSFSEHFYKVFANQIGHLIKEMPSHSNIGCALAMSPPINYRGPLNEKSRIDFYHGTFEDYFNEENEKFDMIDISNISDWMSQEKLQQIVRKAFKALNCNGILIARKLLGDYNWLDIIAPEYEMKVTQVQDNTLFYTQTILAQKYHDNL